MKHRNYNKKSTLQYGWELDVTDDVTILLCKTRIYRTGLTNLHFLYNDTVIIIVFIGKFTKEAVLRLHYI